MSDAAKLRLVAKNQDPTFRLKVSAGLKRRKQMLGENYHTLEAKAKIGRATKERWLAVRDRILPILVWNGEALRKREGFPYGQLWRQLSHRMLAEMHCCARCLSRVNLLTHHIKSARFGGKAEKSNCVVLCEKCHPTVDQQSFKMYEILGDWDTVQYLVTAKLHAGMNIGRMLGAERA